MEKLTTEYFSFGKQYDDLKTSINEDLVIREFKTDKERKAYLKKQIDEISREELEVERQLKSEKNYS